MEIFFENTKVCFVILHVYFNFLLLSLTPPLIHALILQNHVLLINGHQLVLSAFIAAACLTGQIAYLLPEERTRVFALAAFISQQKKFNKFPHSK